MILSYNMKPDLENNGGPQEIISKPTYIRKVHFLDAFHSRFAWIVPLVIIFQLKLYKEKHYKNKKVHFQNYYIILLKLNRKSLLWCSEVGDQCVLLAYEHIFWKSWLFRIGVCDVKILSDALHRCSS